VDPLLEEEARAGGADLALVVEDAGQRPPHRRLQVRVGEDDVRRLPAQLERDALQPVGIALISDGADKPAPVR